MCPGCGRFWTILHVVWGVVYVACGAAQLVAGIFFVISLPELHLGCNVWTGAWNVVIGIVVGMVAFFGRLGPRRQELLLYVAVSILAANAVNAVLSEWCLFWSDLPALVADRPYQTLIYYACFAIRLAGFVVITVSFVDAQFAFCSMEATRNPEGKKLRRSHEQVSDIEYIIPRQKSAKPYSTYSAYSQSWVFDAENGSCSNHTNSPYSKLSPPAVTSTPLPKEPEPALEPKDTAHLIGNPVVQIEEASDDSASNSDRKLNYMKSFSRSASPAVLSTSSSQMSLNLGGSAPPIYECLERLTEASVYRSRLDSALSNREEEELGQYHSPQAVYRRVEALTPQGEKVQYASLMKELQKAIDDKKGSESESTNSTDRNSDAEFSKELEAALQLIHDLESPNAVETPSEVPAKTWRNSDASDSEKTLSAVGSLSPLTDGPELAAFKGKEASRSQSTSGYSSPTHAPTPDWSTASSVNGSRNDLGNAALTCTIRNTRSKAVISLLPAKTNGPNVSVVNIRGSNEVRRSSSSGGSLWNARSILRKKKALPRLNPELEGAIVKSESLAYLSELELLAWHQRNKEIEREIEQRVLQQLGSPRTEDESHC